MKLQKKHTFFWCLLVDTSSWLLCGQVHHNSYMSLALLLSLSSPNSRESYSSFVSQVLSFSWPLVETL